jgi:outer membrane protein assembly factor BamB
MMPLGDRMTLIRISALVIAMISTSACWNSDPVSPNGAANRVIWSSALRGSGAGEVAATTELVFAATDSGLAAIERASGHERWFSLVPGLAGSKRLLVRGGRVLSAGVYSVQANDAVTGAVLWQRVFDVNTAAPDFSDLAADDVALFVGLRDGRALALAQSDGSVLWEAPIATSDWTFKGLLGGSTISGDTVYVTATRYLNANAFEEAAVVVALDRQTGRELWRYQSPGINTSIAHAAVLAGPDLIFTDAYVGAVIALDRATGTERWRQPTYGFFFGAPVIRGDTVFAATSASRAYAFDALTGRVLWTAKLEAGATSLGVCGTELFVGDFHVEVRAAGNGGRVGLAFTGSSEEVVTSLVTVLDGVAYAGTNKRLIALRCR